MNSKLFTLKLSNLGHFINANSILPTVYELLQFTSILSFPIMKNDDISLRRPAG